MLLHSSDALYHMVVCLQSFLCWSVHKTTSVYTNIQIKVFHRKTTKLTTLFIMSSPPTVTVGKQALLSGLVDMHSP